MAANSLKMEKIRLLLKKKKSGVSLRQISVQIGISRNTVRSYLKALEKARITLDSALEMTDEALLKILKIQKYKPLLSKDENFILDLSNYLEQLSTKHMTKQILWEGYIVKHPEGYSYAQFCKLLRDENAKKGLSYIKHHEPGVSLEIDYAGKTLGYWDKSKIHYTECQVFVGILPASNLIFCMAVRNQKQAETLLCMAANLDYIQGVPQTIICDNMKTLVKKTHRYDPSYTEACEQFSLHYNCNVQATRSYKPKDKAKVEGAVKICYQRIYSKLSNKDFYSLESLNGSILELLDELNNRKMKLYDASRWERFYEIERQCLNQLPSTSFELRKSSKLTVQKNYHIYLSEDKHYYSVPYQLVKQPVTVHYTVSNVEIYDKKLKRVALHKRSFNRMKGYTTARTHMPKNHLITKELEGWTVDDFLNKGSQIGTNTHKCFQVILESRNYPQQAFRSCLGILRLGANYGNKRLEIACQLILKDKLLANYKTIENILVKKIDTKTADFSTDNSVVLNHENLRSNYE